MVGQEAERMTLNGKEEKEAINIGHLPVGMYMVEVTGDDGRKYITKFIKQ